MKRFLIIVIYNLGLLVLNAQQIDFLRHTLYEPDIINPKSIHSVDIDNDGDIDHIVDVSHILFDVLWFENDGNHNYTPVEIEYTCDNSGDMEVVDFDLDGDIDILKICDTNMLYLENDGNQNFTTSILISGYLDQYYIKDLDNDGDNDIVVSNEEYDELYWYENVGNNNFTFHLITASFDERAYFNVVDLDNDGDLDIVGAHGLYMNYMKVFWYENDGSQNFTVHYTSSVSIGSSTVFTPLVNVVDLDDDGNLDILAGTKSNSGIYFFKNDGNQIFTDSLILNSGIHPHFNNMASTDIDADGDIDIIQVNSSYGIVLVNDGLENFTSQYIVDSSDVGSNFILVDIDSDGDLDLSMVDNQDDDVFWYENNGGLQFTKHTVYDAPINNPQEMYPIDLDQDSDIDILTTALGAESIVWFENAGNDHFNYTYISNTIGYVTSLSAVDLDNDGDVDVLSSSSNPTKKVWFENDGTQNFTEHLVDSDPTNESYCLKSGDINNDGYIDLIGGGSTKLVVYSNDGTQNFTEQIVLDTNFSFYNLLTFDIDSDGDIDIFPSVGLNNKIFWFENDGVGNFTLHEFQVSSLGQVESYIEDLDSDGDYDIVVATYSGLNYWYKNDGNENFTEIPTFYGFGRSIHGCDINDDGYVDLVSNRGWYAGDDLQNFTFHNSHLTSLGLCDDTYSIDMDYDGDFDILTLSGSDQKLIWHENLLYSNYIKISVIPFIDENGNGVFDGNEYFYQNGVFEMSPQEVFIFPSQDTTTLLLDDTGLYYLDIQLDTALWLATSPTSVPVDVISANYYQTVYFGIQPNEDVVVSSDVTGSRPRCFANSKHFINVANHGLAIDTGYIEYTLDDSVTFISSTPSPDIINGQKLYFSIDNLLTSYNKTVSVKVNMPGTIMMLGHDLKVFADTNQMVMIDSVHFSEMVLCSYDPNDKQVSPNYGNLGYVLSQDTELEYLIRFQNTGNDTAFVVRLVDSLDLNLDESTFRLISNSHPISSMGIDSNRVLTFLFEDINLTDTITNEEESHGFVKFGMKTKNALPLNTSVTNKASIYFDYNSPIITNSTLNTIYNCDVLGNSINITSEYPEITIDMNENYLDTAVWMWNDEIIHSGIEGFTFVPDTVGNIDLTVHLENTLCTFDTTYSIYINNIGIVENKSKIQISVFPNPTTGVFYLDLGKEVSQFTIRLSTITGQILLKETYFDKRMVALELPEINGVYLLEVQTSNGISEFIKVIKQ